MCKFFLKSTSRIITLIVGGVLFSCNGKVNNLNKEGDTMNFALMVDSLNSPVILEKNDKIDSASNSACQSSKMKARSDFQSNKLKYYFFSISGPSPKLVAKLNSINIELVMQNCVVDKELNCYNEIADSIIKVKSGSTISQLYKQLK